MRLPFFEYVRTRVARRVFLLFVVGALVPVLLLAAFAFTAVTDQLRDQSRARLEQLTKNVGMSVLERLLDAEAELNVLAGMEDAVDQPTYRSLLAVARVEPGDTLPGGAPAPRFTEDEWSHMRAGLVLLTLRPDPGGTRLPWLVRLVDPEEPDAGLLWGQVDDGHLWASARTYVELPTVSGFCVVAEVARPLHCGGGASEVLAASMIDAFRVSPIADGRALFQWSSEGEDHLGSSWEIFLASRFHAEPWTAVVAEAESGVYAPLREFALAFPPVLILGLFVVTLLASVQVRRTMEPLERLTKGTRRIADRAFDTRVSVDRDDEFGELATAFNTMAARLGVQFQHLEASRAIDKAALKGTDRDDVVRALLDGFGRVVPCSRLAVVLLEREGRQAHFYRTDDRGMRSEWDIQPDPSDVARLADIQGPTRLVDPDDMPSLTRGLSDGPERILVLPLTMKGEARGAVLAVREGAFGAAEIVHARQLVDQTAVALDEVQLLAELEEMSWGALRALARAIDAKSRWTAGHSERVVQLALAIGRQMRLSEKQLDALERGGLLHDVGKIGVRAEILDARGPLSEEDVRTMQEHVLIGARILEPVPGYQDSIPVVLYHHERWDGSGYPHGLAGEDIPLLARILGVADAYDAMASTRPYRQALGSPDVLVRVRRAAGSQFDPQVVDALERVLEEDEISWQEPSTEKAL